MPRYTSDNLKKIFDAARWSPSCVNEQPWLFFTASRDSESFSDFLACLKSNQLWAKNAGTIGFLVSRRFFKRKIEKISWQISIAGHLGWL